MSVAISAGVLALGALGYRLLVGELPFHLATLVGMINKVLSEPVPSLRDTVPDRQPRVIGDSVIVTVNGVELVTLSEGVRM